MRMGVRLGEGWYADGCQGAVRGWGMGVKVRLLVGVMVGLRLRARVGVRVKTV